MGPMELVSAVSGTLKVAEIAPRVNLRFQPVRQAVVVDEDQIEATPFEIGDRPQQRLS